MRHKYHIATSLTMPNTQTIAKVMQKFMRDIPINTVSKNGAAPQNTLQD